MRSLIVLVLVLPALAGCVSDEPASGSTTPSHEAPLAAFLHDLSVRDPSQVINEGVVEHYSIPGSDGHLLDTWVVHPEGEGPFPLVLEVTPYYGGGSPIDPANALGGYGQRAIDLYQRGYALGTSSVRGTGNSEGCFTQGGPSEAKDTAAVIEFLADQSWSNGNIGLMGVSYPGTTPMDVWVEAPPALKTVVPIEGISDMYKYNFVNGVPIDIQGLGFNTYYWGMVGLAPAGLNGGSQVLDPVRVPGAVVGEVCTEQVDVQQGGASSTVDGNKDGYWMERDFLRELRESPEKQRASIFYIQGFGDWNVKPHMAEDWLPAVQETGVPFKAWLGQWGHSWPEPGGENPCNEGQACRADWWNLTIVAWFDQFLKGVDTGILDAPAVQVQDDDRQWRHETQWPPQDVRWDTYYLDEDVLTMEGPGSGEASYYDYNGDAVDHQAGGDSSAEGAMGPDRVVWRSAPFTANTSLSGLPVFTADVTASGERASLILTLAEESEDGIQRPINYAALSLNHVDSLEDGTADISGLKQTVSVRFFPQEDVVNEGDRLVLIAAGNTVGDSGPALIPISDGSMITIDMATAILELPVKVDPVYEAVQPFDDVWACMDDPDVCD